MAPFLSFGVENMSKPTDPAGPIAVFLPYLGGGGAERAVLEIIRGLIQRGLAVDLIVTRGGGEFWNSVPEEARLVNLNSWKTLTCLPKLVRYLKRRKPEVLISTLVNGNVVSLIIKKYFIRDLILIVRQDSNHTAQYKHSNCITRAQMRMLKWLLPSVNSVISCSITSAEDLKSVVPGASSVIDHIPNPVVHSELFEMARSPLEHPWLNDSRIPVIVTCGRLIASIKDQPTLLKAFAQIRRSREARLIILGDGPDKPKLMNLVQELDIQEDVEFLGFQSNPYPYFSCAHIFVLTSFYEGFSNVLVEALACGTPVVSTDCPSGPREILQNGKWGALVPVGDWKTLARAIEGALDHPPDTEELIARASLYSSTASIDQHVKLLRQVVGPGFLKHDDHSPTA